MRHIILFLLLVVSTVLGKPEVGPLELNDRNFNSVSSIEMPPLIARLQYINGSKMALVKFYATWCPHCTHMAADYSRLAQHFAGDSRVIIAQIDGDRYYNAVSRRYQVGGFPTLKFFHSGSNHAEDADCGRDFESMKRFIESKLASK